MTGIEAIIILNFISAIGISLIIPRLLPMLPRASPYLPHLLPSRPKRMNQPPPPTNYLTITDACTLFNVSLSTIKRLLRRGLPSVLLGRSRRILRQQAEGWLISGQGKHRKRKVQVIKNTGESVRPSDSISEATFLIAPLSLMIKDKGTEAENQL